MNVHAYRGMTLYNVEYKYYAHFLLKGIKTIRRRPTRLSNRLPEEQSSRQSHRYREKNHEGEKERNYEDSCGTN